MKVHISIVNYKSADHIRNCLNNLSSQLSKDITLTVVDNSSEIDSVKNIVKKFHVNYIPNTNVGFGTAHNHLLKDIHSDYYLILNPDVLINFEIKNFLIWMNSNSEYAIASTKILDFDGTTEKSYSKVLTPIYAVICQSFLHKFEIFTRLKKEFWMIDDHNIILETGFLSGALMFFRAEVFKKLGGFDEKIFLYFEDNDICKRALDSGYKIAYNTQYVSTHLKHGSIVADNLRYKNFTESRYYYLKKHFGLLSAIFVEGLLRITEFKRYL